MKTHYELLSLEPTADSDAIKKAFRREIARYHPDKVVHLGAEFQKLAESRAAELTVAYKTLSDVALRAQYDADISTVSATPAPPAPAPVAEPVSQPRPDPNPARASETLHAPSGYRPPTIDEIKTPTPPRGSGRFAVERADRDAILRRAIGARIKATVQDLYGALDTPSVRGFDLALVPVAKARFLSVAPPRVLVKIVEHATGALVSEAWTAASRARVHSGKSPVIVLVFATRIAAQTELSKAWDTLARLPKAPDAAEHVTVMVCDVGDWSCRVPPNISPVVRKLADRLSA